LNKPVDSPIQRAGRKWLGIGGLAVIIVACLIGVVAHQLGDTPLPSGVISYTPLAYSVSGVYSDQRRKAILLATVQSKSFGDKLTGQLENRGYAAGGDDLSLHSRPGKYQHSPAVYRLRLPLTLCTQYDQCPSYLAPWAP